MSLEHSDLTYVIAEAGVNHNGKEARAHEMIDMAVLAKADAVKFQTFRADKLASPNAPKAKYQLETTEPDESQLEMLTGLELNHGVHRELLSHCQEKNIDFLSSPFDMDSLCFLVEELGLQTIKFPSGEITNGPLLLKAAEWNCQIILSTGASTMNEVATALGVLAFGYVKPGGFPSITAFDEVFASLEGKKAISENVCLLQCTSEYPAPIEAANIRVMDTLADTFKVKVGFSDHTRGYVAALAAVARGAVIIEKHFTLDRALPGPDHSTSMEPKELSRLINDIREIERVLGSAEKRVTISELATREVIRKSLVAGVELIPGQIITHNDLTTMRPGTGDSPMNYWSHLGMEVNVGLSVGDLFTGTDDK